MNKLYRLKSALIACTCVLFSFSAYAASAGEIDAKSKEALDKLYAESTAAKELSEQAKGMLVFPSITKAGLGVGGEFGEGALMVDGAPVAYYNSVSASIGFQAGISSRSQVIMFLEQDALDKFQESNGWEAGVDANITVLELGGTIEGNTSNIQDPIVAFVFGEKGLMAGISLEGSKYTKIDK